MGVLDRAAVSGQAPKDDFAIVDEAKGEQPRMIKQAFDNCHQGSELQSIPW